MFLWCWIVMLSEWVHALCLKTHAHIFLHHKLGKGKNETERQKVHLHILNNLVGLWMNALCVCVYLLKYAAEWFGCGSYWWQLISIEAKRDGQTDKKRKIYGVYEICQVLRANKQKKKERRFIEIQDSNWRAFSIQWEIKPTDRKWKCIQIKTELYANRIHIA